MAVFPDADIPSVAVEMADYNLTALPVVDDAGRILGVVTYDDLVDALIPDLVTYDDLVEALIPDLVTYDDLVEALIPDEWRWRTRPTRSTVINLQPSPDADPACPGCTTAPTQGACASGVGELRSRIER